MTRTRWAAVVLAVVLAVAACGGGDGGSPSGEAAGPTATATTAPAGGDPGPLAPGPADPGDVVVVDNGGRLLVVDPATGVVSVLSDDAISRAAGGEALFGDNFGVAQEPGGDFIVIVRSGTADGGPNPDPSRVVRVDRETGAQSLVNADDDLTFLLTAVAVGPDGAIYVADEAAGGDEPGSVIHRIDPASGAKELFTSNVRFEDRMRHGIEGPLGMVVDADGFWVLGSIGGDDAAPASPSDFVGAIVELDPGTGAPTLLTSNHRSTGVGGAALFGEPRFLARAADGSFLVVDDRVLNDAMATGNDTRVVRVDPTTGAQSLVSDNARSEAAGGERLFERPYGVAVLADGALVVGDGDRLLRVDAATGAQRVLATGLGTAIAVIVAG